jgi:hypothetical protein
MEAKTRTMETAPTHAYTQETSEHHAVQRASTSSNDSFTHKEIHQISCQISNERYHTEIYIWKSILDSSDRTWRTDHHIRNLNYTTVKEEIPPILIILKFTISMFWKISNK